jgi:hypothetical protein
LALLRAEHYAKLAKRSRSHLLGLLGALLAAAGRAVSDPELWLCRVTRMRARPQLRLNLLSWRS